MLKPKDIDRFMTEVRSHMDAIERHLLVLAQAQQDTAAQLKRIANALEDPADTGSPGDLSSPG